MNNINKIIFYGYAYVLASFGSFHIATGYTHQKFYPNYHIIIKDNTKKNITSLPSLQQAIKRLHLYSYFYPQNIAWLAKQKPVFSLSNVTIFNCLLLLLAAISTYVAQKNRLTNN